MAEYDYNAADTWMCSCGKTNTGKFCVKCGAPRPAAPPPPAPAPRAEWVCTCGKVNTGKFCAKCGSPRPAAEPKKTCRGKTCTPGRKACTTRRKTAETISSGKRHSSNAAES